MRIGDSLEAFDEHFDDYQLSAYELTSWDLPGRQKGKQKNYHYGKRKRK